MVFCYIFIFIYHVEFQQVVELLIISNCPKRNHCQQGKEYGLFNSPPTWPPNGGRSRRGINTQ
jgi:hypothetical protein